LESRIWHEIISHGRRELKGGGARTERQELNDDLHCVFVVISAACCYLLQLLWIEDQRVMACLSAFSMALQMTCEPKMSGLVLFDILQISILTFP
jgi:hypothetical protein